MTEAERTEALREVWESGLRVQPKRIARLERLDNRGRVKRRGAGYTRKHRKGRK